MLSHWTKNAGWFIDSQLRAAGLSASKEGGGDYVINLDTLRGIVLPFPENALQHVAGICGETITPIYKILADDIEAITQLLLELETSYPPEESSSCEPEDNHPKMNIVQRQDTPEIPIAQTVHNSRPRARISTKRRCPTPPPVIPIVIPSTHPSAPSIMITPCGSQNQEGTCRVPYQNSQFGNFLTVPSHSSYNDVHPPMLSSPYTLPPQENWVWRNGHWEAVLPCLQQQEKCGLFSKLHSARRRSHRPSGNEH